MALNITQKIIADHLVYRDGQAEARSGNSGQACATRPGEEIALRIDQTLTQDVTGTMAYLQFEALGVPRVQTKLSVSYVDHNMLQVGFESADDHRYLQSAAAKYGVHFSRPGNGICHQVHLERFSAPGETLIGSDSHTPTCGGVGMLAIGAGGLEVAAAMAGYPLYLAMPRVTLVRITGSLPDWVSAKDVILEVLRRLTVRGGVGRVMEYGGPGVATLSVPERATIANMGAELGATSSIFPSDERTRAFLRAQGREEVWRELSADPDATYEDVIELDLSALEPLVAQPYSPDKVAPAAQLAGAKVSQVAIGSCTNSSYRDLMTVAGMLEGKRVHPGVSLVIAPGSRQVLEMLAESGALGKLIKAGARMLEAACGPCIGMGQAPASGATTLRSFNRNFEGRCGTEEAPTYLAGVEVCAAAAIAGEIVDPRTLGEPVRVVEPEAFIQDDGMVIPPSDRPEEVEIVRGPNIAPLPRRGPLADTIRGKVLLVAGDNITTDDIMPAGAKILPLRSNIPAISRYVFSRMDPEFAERARREGGGFIVGGANYGQGSSREHAALAPMALGIRAVLARSFARIHQANLVNFGILPLEVGEDAPGGHASAYGGRHTGPTRRPISQGDELEIGGVRAAIEARGPLTVTNLTNGERFEVSCELTPRQARIVLAGGLLNYIREEAKRRRGEEAKRPEP
jgi:aconitate hydratase